MGISEIRQHIEAAAAALGARSGMTQDWIVGLTPAETPEATAETIRHLQEAEETLSRLKAEGLEGADAAEAHHEIGSAWQQAGNRDNARAHFQAAVQAEDFSVDAAKKLAELQRVDGEFDAALVTWEKVLTINPTYRRGLARLVSVGARGSMQWPRIWAAVRQLEPLKKGGSPYRNPALRKRLDALFAADHTEAATITAEQAEEIVTTLEEMANNGRHLKPTVLTLVLMRIQFAGHFRLGFRLRQLGMQRRIAEHLVKPVGEELTKLRNLIKALVYTGAPEVAVQLIEMQRWAKDDPRSTQRLQKMRADALILSGQLQAYYNYSAELRQQNPLPGEERMAELIGGKRVAVVGPADTGDRLGEIIDSYDVVVRPRYQPEFVAAHTATMGSRTDITYYSGFDMEQLLAEAEAAVTRGDLQMVNARPFTYAAYAERNHQWLRFYRHDYALCPAGGQLGIQRMAYDLLQFQPAEICIFNSDFYTGNQMFTTGWRPQDSFGPGSHINDIVAAHDIRFDLQFTQALQSAGVLTAQGRAADVLKHDTETYLAAVEKAGVLR
ncbi:hypothetical protein HGQ17_13900 [Nesterenkonia sp. MY13]|uniref:Tetratricopeptide repeat protein n=1 Tax=Nesterenkonia sedimenti TaxID=1463632 RepID=A0A7X8TN33_9MICC|nr:hypothetical protein [Nesterenkonia sedimenti]NLS11068.1 hypothetical protein [Nesterenkonia sedimenti]